MYVAVTIKKAALYFLYILATYMYNLNILNLHNLNIYVHTLDSLPGNAQFCHYFSPLTHSITLTMGCQSPKRRKKHNKNSQNEVHTNGMFLKLYDSFLNKVNQY